MLRLIHLNGPPGIGKSTLAQMYADEHPGVLNLDIDQLRTLVGGWRDSFAETGELVRPLALGMAGTHLRAGHDVILPQYLGRLSEIHRFERVARDASAAFCEVALMDTKERSAQRFTDRGGAAALPWHRHVQAVVERSGGTTLLHEMHDRLVDVVQARPDAVVVPSVAGAVDRTYDAFVAVLEEGVPTPAARSARRLPAVAVRTATDEDWPQVWPIFDQIVRAGQTYAFPEDLSPGPARPLWMERPPGQTVVALLDEVVVGSAKMGPNRPGRGAHVATASFMVAATARGHGVGRALGSHVIDWALDEGYRGIQFNAVVETNTRAIALWQSLGFEIVGTVPEAFDHPSDGLVGLHVMYRGLDR